VVVYLIKYWRYIAILLAVGVVWLHGHSMGSSSAELRCNQEKTAIRDAIDANKGVAHDTERKIRALPVGDAAKRLQEHWTRG
jgi:hypothetical protein